MENYSVLQTMTLADIVGVFLILVIALGSFSLMWIDYSVYTWKIITSSSACSISSGRNSCIFSFS